MVLSFTIYYKLIELTTREVCSPLSVLKILSKPHKIEDIKAIKLHLFNKIDKIEDIFN